MERKDLQDYANGLATVWTGKFTSNIANFTEFKEYSEEFALPEIGMTM